MPATSPMSMFVTAQVALEIASKSLQIHPCSWPGCSQSLNCWETLVKHIKCHCDAMLQQPVSKCILSACEAAISNSQLLYTHFYDTHLSTIPIACPAAGCTVHTTYNDLLSHLLSSHGKTTLIRRQTMQATYRPTCPAPTALPMLPDVFLPSSALFSTVSTATSNILLPPSSLSPGAYQNLDFVPDTDVQFGQLDSRATTQRLHSSLHTPELEDFSENGIILPFSVSCPQPFSTTTVVSSGIKPQGTTLILQQAAPALRIAGPESFTYQFNTEKMHNLLNGSGQFAKLRIQEDKTEEM
ncbi:hypothetical protein PsYK624_051680 [Phanerochaete sordida]|uniref:C2H2-type domain-containing protein n=1 Tax=Phanerochaete sordida TaxID=48140 RepID=A0A9P3G6C2_9APHY|nr:hypothetical protein PsYK624_051680 [Phanerochaete sordida]